MPRLRTPLLLAVLCGCTPPALKHLLESYPDTSTGDTSSSSSTGGPPSETSIMTTTEGSGSGDASTSSSTEPSTTTGVHTTSSDVTSTTSTASTASPEPVCGDGVVEGDEECDDLTDRCFECTKNRWIFASAVTDHQGDLGGLAGADSLCRQYALQSNRAPESWMTFIAWLSDSDHDVRDRLYPGRGRYLRTDGVAVVTSVDQFYSGMLEAPINIDEHGDPAPGGVLTGTNPDGTAAPGAHCENWTTSSALQNSAYYGSTGSIDANWTRIQNPDVNPNSCSTERRLYCVEGE